MSTLSLTDSELSFAFGPTCADTGVLGDCPSILRYLRSDCFAPKFWRRQLLPTADINQASSPMISNSDGLTIVCQWSSCPFQKEKKMEVVGSATASSSEFCTSIVQSAHRQFIDVPTKIKVTSCAPRHGIGDHSAWPSKSYAPHSKGIVFLTWSKKPPFWTKQFKTQFSSRNINNLAKLSRVQFKTRNSHTKTQERKFLKTVMCITVINVHLFTAVEADKGWAIAGRHVQLRSLSSLMTDCFTFSPPPPDIVASLG